MSIIFGKVVFPSKVNTQGISAPKTGPQAYTSIAHAAINIKLDSDRTEQDDDFRLDIEPAIPPGSSRCIPTAKDYLERFTYFDFESATANSLSRLMFGLDNYQISHSNPVGGFFYEGITTL
ncbi:hypothetical protein G7Y89_g11036 [Cudoniella acicularis]|uniref:Uncharacterized protein n=1 Tax=Cudoniella acicularis TaxID=354080 RepID=A0A8H4RD41_9HELO|nr:hypothetical protein G7Y89_g11036 [Cudoniella acicularis]